MLDPSNVDSNVNSYHSKKQLDNPNYFINRELSWIRFNARVLEEARDLWHPLLERVKFLAICGSNLDEFFMTRVPRLLKKLSKGSDERSMDGMTFMEQIEATRKEIMPLIQNHADCWRNELLPALAKEDIYIRAFNDLSVEKRECLREFFSKFILPEIIIPKEGFNGDAIENLHINLLVLGFSGNDSYYIIDVPTDRFGRLIRIPKSGYHSEMDVDSVDHNFVFLEDLIENNLDLIFPSESLLAAYPFRLTRNGEIDILMDESSDFLNSVKRSLSSRKAGFPSRLEFDKKTPFFIREAIATALKLPKYLTYESDGPLGLVDIWQLLKIKRSDLKDKTFLPSVLPLLTAEKNIFTTFLNETSCFITHMTVLKLLLIC